MRQDCCVQWFSNWKGQLWINLPCMGSLLNFPSVLKILPFGSRSEYLAPDKAAALWKHTRSGLSLAWHNIFQRNGFHRRRAAPAAVTFSIPIVDLHCIKMHVRVRKKRRVLRHTFVLCVCTHTGVLWAPAVLMTSALLLQSASEASLTLVKRLVPAR